jgi:hypothetical protein
MVELAATLFVITWVGIAIFIVGAFALVALGTIVVAIGEALSIVLGTPIALVVRLIPLEPQYAKSDRLMDAYERGLKFIAARLRSRPRPQHQRTQ